MTTPESIHTSAVVDARARIGRGVRIGAFSVIGPDVTLEDEAEIGHHVVLEGRVAVGPRARIGHGAILGGIPQDLKYKPGTPTGVRIGADTVVREYVTIHRATQPEAWTEIGRECLVMAMSHIAHDCRLGDGVIVINYAGITGHCQIGDRATIGGLSGMVPFTRVGAYAYIGGCSKVVLDVPPYMLVDGAPATVHGVNVVGLRRAGVSAGDRRALQDAYRALWRSGVSPRLAAERLREDGTGSAPVRHLLEFILSGRRGVCGPPRGDAGPVAAGETTGAGEGEYLA